MSLDLKLQSLLRTSEVKEINFALRGIRVTGHGFWELSNHLSDHYIRRRLRVVVAPGLVGRNLATYHSGGDVIQVRSPDVLATPSAAAS